MRGPDMATITASLERSLQNCSLNGAAGGGVAGFTSPSSSDSPEIRGPHSADDGLDLNLQISLPYDWEQCLDLQTGEVYFTNWRTGLKAKDDPRTSGDFDTEDEDDDDVDDDDDDSSYDETEEPLYESSPSSYARREPEIYDDHHNYHRPGKGGDVLVVVGCKGCLMYFMVPKQDSVCPKCHRQLLHFDQSDGIYV